MIAVDFPAVPISDRIAQMIGATIPLPILQAEIDAELEAREVLSFRAPQLSAQLHPDDRTDREAALSRLAAANKILAAWNPLLVLKAGGGSR